MQRRRDPNAKHIRGRCQAQGPALDLVLANGKHLDIQRIAEIKRATGIFLTLHGGSGTDAAELLEGIQAGMNVVHINTELRLAWRRGLENALAKRPDEIAPYHLLPAAYDAVSEVVRVWLQTFQRSSSAGA